MSRLQALYPFLFAVLIFSISCEDAEQQDDKNQSAVIQQPESKEPMSAETGDDLSLFAKDVAMPAFTIYWDEEMHKNTKSNAFHFMLVNNTDDSLQGKWGIDTNGLLNKYVSKQMASFSLSPKESQNLSVPFSQLPMWSHEGFCSARAFVVVDEIGGKRLDKPNRGFSTEFFYRANPDVEEIEVFSKRQFKNHFGGRFEPENWFELDAEGNVKAKALGVIVDSDGHKSQINTEDGIIDITDNGEVVAKVLNQTI